MTVAAITPPSFDIGQVVNRTFGVIGRNLVSFGVLAVLASIPEAVLNVFVMQQAAGAAAGNPAYFLTASYWLILLASTVTSIVLNCVLQAALVSGAIIDLNGGRASFGQMLTTGLKAFFPVVAIAILSALAEAVGIILLIVPGIMLAVAWTVVVPVRIVEDKPIFECFGRSAALTKGHRWAIFGIAIVFYIGVGILSAMLRPVLGLTMTAGVAEVSIIGVLFTGAVRVVTAVVAATGVACIYYELRTGKEGVGAEHLAAVFA